MHPILFEFGGYRIGTYGLMMLTAFIVAWLLLRSELKRKGLKPVSSDLLLAAMVGGIVGAKVLYLLEHREVFNADPLGSVLSMSGLTWYGGLIGGTAAYIGYMLIKKIPNPAYGDALAPSLAIGLALGRVG